MRFAPLAMAVAVAIAAPIAAHAAEKSQPLVDTAWLKAHQKDDNVVVLDIRTNVANTDLGDKPYIAHAAFAPYDQGWRAKVDGVKGQVPPTDQISAKIGKLGISNDDHVVIVPWGTDSEDFGTATRVYWTFKYLGDNNVSILDGGWRQYVANGGARAAKPEQPKPATFVADIQPQLRATTAEVAAALKSGTLLIDARPPAQYDGTVRNPSDRVPGTLPGAKNLPNSDFYSAKYARFASPQTVEALAQKLGVKKEEKNISFCNTGHLATVTWFGLHEIMGDKNATMYDGSMSEWTQDPKRPVVVVKQ